jgi:hypothetical protein
MRPGKPDDDEDRTPAGAHAELSGSAGDVVQARDVHGGVHFHGAARPGRHVPRQLPGDVRGFVNRVSELERLGKILIPDGDVLRSTGVCVIAGTAGARHRVGHRTGQAVRVAGGPGV